MNVHSVLLMLPDFFGLLAFLLYADPAPFRTGWFMESVISASMIVLVIRTHQPKTLNESSINK